VSRSARCAAALAIALAAMSVLAPAGAFASFVVRESTQSYDTTFAGETCGSTSTRSLQVPARAYDITPIALPVGSVLNSGDDLGAGYSMRVNRVFLPAACGGPHYRPTRVVLACGDGNLQLLSLGWTHWNDRAATAHGVVWANDCTPFCAAGHFHRYAARVRASQPGRCRGVYQYLHVRYRLLHRAHGVSRTGRISFGSTCEAL
jgi:hypothetical protein